jgi:hypothetical protein
MATDTYSPQDQQSVTTLVSGIIGDAQTLIQQQVALIREEVRTDLRKTKEAVVSLAAGVGVAALAAVPLVFAVVYLLNERAGWQLWASFLTVGVVLAAAGAGLIFAGVRRIRSFNPLPEQSMAALKENLEWIKNPK